MSTGLSHLEAPHSQQQSALVLGSSELHIKVWGFFVMNSDPYSFEVPKASQEVQSYFSRSLRLSSCYG